MPSNRATTFIISGLCFASKSKLVGYQTFIINSYRSEEGARLSLSFLDVYHSLGASRTNQHHILYEIEALFSSALFFVSDDAAFFRRVLLILGALFPPPIYPLSSEFLIWYARGNLLTLEE